MSCAWSRLIRFAFTSLISALIPAETSSHSRRGRWLPQWVATAGLAIVLGVVFCCAASAQTAHFSGAQITLGGGFSAPRGVAVDTSGNVYVADSGNNEVKEIPAGCLTASCVVQLGGSYGFVSPKGMAVDASGDVFVADSSANKVEELTPNCFSSSCVTVLGGGYSFNDPTGLAVDAGGDVFIAVYGAGNVVEIPSGCTLSSCVKTIGSGFTSPDAVAVDGSNSVFVTDNSTEYVSEIHTVSTPYDTTTRLATGFTFESLRGIALDSSGNLYVADSSLDAVEELTYASGYSTVVTLASNYNAPRGVAVDTSGNVYIGDMSNNAVEEVKTSNLSIGSINVGSTSSAIQLIFTFDSGGTIEAPEVLTQGAANLDFKDTGNGTCTTRGTSYSYSAGNTCIVDVSFTPEDAGTRFGAVELLNHSGGVIATAYIYGTGTGPQVVFLPSVTTELGSSLSTPHGLVVDASGNIYVADTGASEIVEILAPSYTTTNVLGGGFNSPRGVAVDGCGNVFVGDGGNAKVKEIPYGCASSACVVTLASSFSFSDPYGVAVDGNANVFVNDYAASKAYEILAAGGYTTVNTLASGFSFYDPYGIAVDGNSNVFIADEGNNAVHEVLAAGGYTTVNTLGSGFSAPRDVAVDGSGNVYVADGGNGALKEILEPSGYVTVQTLGTGYPTPEGVAVNGAGDIFLANSGNTWILKEGYSSAPTFTFPTATDVGTTDTADGAQTVTLLNNGNASLTFTVPGSGTNPSISSGFSLDASTTCPQVSTSGPDGSLLPGASCTYAVDFVPTVSGTNSGTLGIADNNLNVAAASQSIAMSGTGSESKTTPTISWTTPAAIAYGTALGATQLDATSGGVAGTFTYTPASGTVLSAGSNQTLSVAFAPSDTTDYNSASGSTTITVNKAAPQISWTAPAAITYGTALGATQLDASSGGVAGAFTYTPASGTVLSAGSNQTLSVAFTPSDTTDYSSSSGSTTITVNKGTPTISWTTPAAITYGTTLGATQLDASSGGVAGAFNYTPASGTVLSAGSNQTLSVAFTPSDTTDYNSASESTTITVNKAAPAVVLGSSANPVFLMTALTFTATASSSAGTPSGSVSFYDGATLLGSASLVSGVATYATSAMTAGTHSITAAYSGDNDFSPLNSAALSEAVQDFSVVISTSGGGTTSVTATPGGVAAYPLVVTPLDGSKFPGQVTFSIKGLPAGATGTFTPAALPANSGTSNVQLTVNLPPLSTAQLHRSPISGGPMTLAFGLMLLPFAVRLRQSSVIRRSRQLNAWLRVALPAIAVAASLLGLVGCASRSSGFFTQPSQTYTLTITATTGSLSHSTTVTLTVE